MFTDQLFYKQSKKIGPWDLNSLAFGKVKIKACSYCFRYYKLEILNVSVENVLELQIPKCLIAVNY